MGRVAVGVVFGVGGVLVGSFLTVVVHRVPRGESLVTPASRCPACGAGVRPWDNLPVVSFILLGGRCRSCGARIPLRYPLTELASAGLFVASALAFAQAYVAAVVALFGAVLLALALIDLEHRILPNRIVYPSLVAFAVLVAVGDLAGMQMSVPGAAVGFLAYGGALLLVALVARGGMGMGDVKLAALIGLVVGSLGLERVAAAAGVAVVSGGAAALVALLRGASRKEAIPFGPFLAAGGLAGALAGGRRAAAYLRLVL